MLPCLGKLKKLFYTMNEELLPNQGKLKTIVLMGSCCSSTEEYEERKKDQDIMGLLPSTGKIRNCFKVLMGSCRGSSEECEKINEK